MASDENITLARLDGAAGRLVATKADRAAAVVELQAISTSPRLLGQAAGTALGSWRADDARGRDGDRRHELLVAAGGDAAIAEQRAVETQAWMSRHSSGIGNP